MPYHRNILFTVALICCLTISGQTTDSIPTASGKMHKQGSPRKRDHGKGLMITPLEALQGDLPGVNVSRGGNERLAMLNSVRVRGTTSVTGGNDPLVVIDGISSDLATLSTIYPADIASFKVLKNAAETAQYGSRGASGVIIVTTKKGLAGKFSIAYDANAGIEKAHSFIKMLGRRDYLSTAQTLGLPYVDGGYDTDFQRAITRTGTVQNHHLAFTGGTETANYRASVSYMTHRMVVKTNDYRNFTAKFDLMQKGFDDILTVDFGIFGSSLSSGNLYDMRKLFYSAATQNPTYATGRNATGGWSTNAGASQIPHPMGWLGIENDDKGFSFNTHIGLDFILSKAWRLHLFGSYAYNSLENALFLPLATEAQGKAVRRERKGEDVLGNISFTYRRQWRNHKIEAEVQSEYQRSRQTGFYTTVKGFTGNAFGYHNLGAGAIRPQGGTGSGYESPTLLSFMGRADYTYLNRYRLSVTSRADGSSLVGRNHRWGFFPSVGAEWDIHQEHFMRDLSFINRLSLHSGYGISGNLGGIESYNSLHYMTPIGVIPYGNTPTITMGLMKNINPDLKWESRSSFNIGIESAWLDNRLVFTAEYYYSKTRDMLYPYPVSVPPFAYNTLLANIGSMSNSGVELGLGVVPVSNRDLELNININLSFQTNKLLSLSGMYRGEYLSSSPITPIGSMDGTGFHGGDNNIVYQIVGRPLGVFYLPHCTGLAKNPDGSYSYQIADLDKNGRINTEDGGDRYVAGQAVPKATLGSNISLRYRNWDVSMQLNGAFGHKIYNATALTYMNMGAFPDYNVMADAPRRNIKDQRATDYWLESGDYVNIDYVTIGYNVPLKSKFMSALRLSCSVNNIATFTAYSGTSPMINSYVVNATLGIDDKDVYPVYRSFAIGVGIQF